MKGARPVAGLLLGAALVGGAAAQPVHSPDLGPADRGAADRVKVFAGTSNSRWQLFPGATLPFGLVKLSPDNQGNVWNGGYEYTVASISGFSHLHAMGLSGLSLMPTVGPLQIDPSSSRLHPGAPDGPFGGMWTAGWRSRFDKATEHGAPGYYSVELMDYGVKAELTSTLRCGYLRVTFPKSDRAHVLIDFDFPTEEKTEILGVDFRRVAPGAFEGHVRQRNQYAGTHDVYFVIGTSKPVTSVQTWRNGDYTGSDTNYGTAWRRKSVITPLGEGLHTATAADSSRRGIILNFSTAEREAVVVRTGLSMVSAEGARRNLAQEAGPFGFDFDRVAAAAKQVWNKRLGAIEVSDENPARADTFYTAFYRTFAGKSVVNDVDGAYVDFSGKVAHLRKPADAVYSSDGLWGTQWDLTPLWTLAAPDVAVSLSNSLLALADRGGWVPEAPVALKYSPIMGAQHQDALIVASVQKGLKGVDPARAYAAIRHDLTTPGTALPDGQFAGDKQLAPYLHHGYVPDEVGAASNTLEYAYDDSCAASLAQRVGRGADATMFAARAGSWRNQFDPAVGYMRRRHADGTFVAGFDPDLFGTIGGWNGAGFMEGSAWTYSFWVPQDVPGLVKAVGADKFNRRLEEGFETGKVDLTNEPGLQSPFLFNYSGKPWLTQKITRKVVDENFDTSPYHGWAGEEDEGQLTAYFVLLSMGLFEMDGGCSTKPFYDLTSPAFHRVVLHLDPAYYPGRTVTIESEGAPGDVYIQSATWNGRSVTAPRLSHAELSQGGTLRFVLGPRPNEAWGKGG